MAPKREHAEIGDFHLEICSADRAWGWTVFHVRTGSKATGNGKSLEEVKGWAESVAGAAPNKWRPIGGQDAESQ